jgi:5-methyltetrahydrofolate--homocysteine methyltransferase
MDQSDIEEIAELIADLDDEAEELVQECIDAGLDPVEVLKGGVVKGLEKIGILFEQKEYFLAELMVGGELAENCIKIIDPHLPESSDGERQGTVVIGAVSGDLHDIGYGLVAKQLELAGFEVHSLGVNIDAMDFIKAAQEKGANIIGLSAFLVTTIPNCRDVVNYVKDMGLQDQFKVVMGGAETNQEKSDMMGADGWAPNAMEAVTLCKNIMAEHFGTG